MYRITFLLVIFILSLVSHPFAKTLDDSNFSGVLKSRQVAGVIYFKKNSVKLSKLQQAEIDRIASIVVSQSSPNKIVRIEGFSIKRSRRVDPLTLSLSRAKSVWHYFEKIDSLNSSNLYLTGFSTKQSISTLQGDRVEIAIYENPFKEKMDIFSSN